MAGYATTARVAHPSVRRRGGPAPATEPSSSAVALPGATEPALEPLEQRVACGRLADLRAAWARTTFYLFSPDSWR